MWDIFKNGIILMIYSIVAGTALAYVYLITTPIIEARKIAAANAARSEVLAGIEGGFEQVEGENSFIYWIGYKDEERSQPGGYVFIASGEGYQSTVETMIGVDTDFTITGAKVLFQGETPGLGDKIVAIKAGEDAPWFPRQFIGKSLAENLSVNKDGGVIDAISGATVSSRTVAESVKYGLTAIKAYVSGEEFVAPEVVKPPDPKDKPITMPDDEQLAEHFPGMLGGFEIQEDVPGFPYWIAYSDFGQEEIAGYAFLARKVGFSSMIETLVVTDIDGNITGTTIIDHGETAEYGSKMEDINDGEEIPWFQKQFIGKSAEETVAIKEDDGDIDAITDATITSRAFTRSVDFGLRVLRAALNSDEYEMPVDELEPPDIPDDEVLAEVLPGMIGGYVIYDEETSFPYWEAYSDFGQEELEGYLFIAQAEGFAGVVATLVALDLEGTITGIQIISHEETDDWGDKIEEIREGEDDPWFPRQLIGKTSADTIALTEDGGDIDAVTEATISSNAVVKPVAAGLKKMMEVIE